MGKTEQNNYRTRSYNNKGFCFLQPPGSGPPPAPGILYERFKSAIEGLRFTRFDKIVLTAEKVSFPNIAPRLNSRLSPHPGGRWIEVNKGGVKYAFWNKWVIRVPGGQLETGGNSIRLNLFDLDTGKPLYPQILETVRYLLEKGYIEGPVEAAPAVLSCFRVSEVELNGFFTDPALFRMLKSETEGMSFAEAREHLRETGSKQTGVRLDRGANALRSLNRYEQSAYLWANESSKLFAYNVTAKAEKRDSHRPGDTYKIELTLRSPYMKAHPVDVGNLEGLLTDVRGTRLFRKARAMLLEPVEYALTRRQLLRGLKRRPTAGKPSAPRPVMPPRTSPRWKSGQISPNLIEFYPGIITKAPGNRGPSP
jgi:hypothetical protein